MICYDTHKKRFLSNYADDNTLYPIGNTIESVRKALRNDFRSSIVCEVNTTVIFL